MTDVKISFFAHVSGVSHAQGFFTHAVLAKRWSQTADALAKTLSAMQIKIRKYYVSCTRSCAQIMQDEQSSSPAYRFDSVITHKMYQHLVCNCPWDKQHSYLPPWHQTAMKPGIAINTYVQVSYVMRILQPICRFSQD